MNRKYYKVTIRNCRGKGDLKKLMIAEAIERLADRVLAYEDTNLTQLLNHFKSRMEELEPGPEWERAVISYFLLNGVRMKNALKLGNQCDQGHRLNGSHRALCRVK